MGAESKGPPRAPRDGQSWTRVLASPLILWLALGAIGLQLYLGQRAAAQRIPYSAFREALAEGKVAQVQLSDTEVTGKLRGDGEPFAAVRVEDPELFAELRARGVVVTGVVPHQVWNLVWIWVLPLGAGLLLLAMWRRAGRTDGGAGSFLAVGKSRVKIYEEKDIPVRFEDVAGVDEAKQELQEVINFLKHPEPFARVGGRIPKGILLVGPPGTGKTLLARAVAGESQVPFFSISGSEFVELFVGVGAARVRDLFAQARAKAPCIIFIDELDALGKVRGAGPMAHEEREQTLNQLLVELDGFDQRSGVVLMAATNRPEILDPALLRAGRFDRHVLVDRPDRAGRLAILRVHAKKIQLEDGVDLDGVAGLTAGMVGADMANLVNEAALVAVRRGKERVGRAELEEAVERVVAGLEKKNRVLNAKEKERVAHHEVGHALVAMAMPGADPIRKISIIPRGIAALGYTIQLPTEDRFLMTRSELEGKIAVLLGGRVAEELVFGEVSTGALDDLRKATEIARSMVRAYGMSEELGPISVEPERRPFLPEAGFRSERGDYSEALARRIDQEVRALVERQRARATLLLSERLPALRRAALELLRKETLSGEELTALVDEAPAASSATQGVNPHFAS
jgi:cell division protease FtsH